MMLVVANVEVSRRKKLNQFQIAWPLQNLVRSEESLVKTNRIKSQQVATALVFGVALPTGYVFCGASPRFKIQLDFQNCACFSDLVSSPSLQHAFTIISSLRPLSPSSVDHRQQPHSMDPQKENTTKSEVAAKPAVKAAYQPMLFKMPVSKVKKPATSTEAKPTVQKTEPVLFKTPLKTRQGTNTTTANDLGDVKSMLDKELATMNVDKPIVDQISSSVKKPTVSRSNLLKTHTPISDKKGKHAHFSFLNPN